MTRVRRVSLCTRTRSHRSSRYIQRSCRAQRSCEWTRRSREDAHIGRAQRVLRNCLTRTRRRELVRALLSAMCYVRSPMCCKLCGNSHGQRFNIRALQMRAWKHNNCSRLCKHGARFSQHALVWSTAVDRFRIAMRVANSFKCDMLCNVLCCVVLLCVR